MSDVRIPIYGEDKIDGNWPNSEGYTETATCEDIRNNFDKYYYELNPGTPKIGLDDIDGNFVHSLGYSMTETCQTIRKAIQDLKKQYHWDECEEK